MTRNKKMIILLTALVILVGAYFGITAWAERAAQSDDGKTYYMTDFDTESVVQLDWWYDGEYYVLSKIDGQWVDPYNEDFMVDQAAAEAMASAVSNIQSRMIIDDAADYTQYGFYDDSEGIRVELADGSTSIILTGNYNEVALDYYAMVKGENDIHVVSGMYLDSFEVTMADLEAAEDGETEETE